MSLAHRIIPTLLCRGRQLVKGQGFNSWRSVGLVAQAVRIHQARQVDELVLLDVSATAEGRGPDLALIEELADSCFMPLTVGGGIKTVNDVRALLRAGADKVVIGTAAIEQPGFIREVSDVFGAQAVVVSVDARAGEHAVYRRCGTRTLPFTPAVWAAVCEEAGAGEILLQSIDRDGTMQGYDLGLIAEVARAVSIPVIASGGCKDYDDMRAALNAGASAVAAGALFQFTDATPRGAAQHLDKAGIRVRLAA